MVKLLALQKEFCKLGSRVTQPFPLFFPLTAHSKESRWDTCPWRALGPQHTPAITADPGDRALSTRASLEQGWHGELTACSAPGMKGQHRAGPPSKILPGGKSSLSVFFQGLRHPIPHSSFFSSLSFHDFGEQSSLSRKTNGLHGELKTAKSFICLTCVSLFVFSSLETRVVSTVDSCAPVT